MNWKEYLLNVVKTMASLFTGMARTFSSMVHPGRILTQPYPENRHSLYIPQRFKAELILLKNAEGALKCTACTLCQTACPNGSIQITTQTVTDEEGKKHRRVESYLYHLGSCSFCGQCVEACNFEALAFTSAFENSEYIKERLDRELTTRNDQSKTANGPTVKP